MNFEDLQSLWASQTPSPGHPKVLAERQRALVHNFKRRRRLLGYEAFCALFGLVAFPFLSIVNHLYLPRVGTPAYWTSTALHVAVLIIATVFVWRRWQRHKTLGRVRISTLREQSQVALTQLEAERREYRWLPWALGLWAALALLSVFVNTPFHGGSGPAVTLRIGLILGFFGAVGAVFWRHYRRNLLPAFAQQREILRQLDEAV